MNSNHLRLIDACYPASAVLASAAGDHRPNAQELSRLTYYASNRPGKLTKLGIVLEKRVRADARKAGAGHIKAKATLQVTLGIYKALATECKNDLTLLAPSLLAAVDATLSAMPNDLEIAAKTANVFTAWATFTDGNLVGADGNLSKVYLDCLKHLARLSTVSIKSTDDETQARTRLVGLAALTSVVNSNVFLHPSAGFVAQCDIIIPALLQILSTVKFVLLQEEYAAIKAHPAPSSPYLAQFHTRPSVERRAASIHIHVDGEKGPTEDDVANATIRVFQILSSRCSASQISQLLDAYFAFLDRESRWEAVQLCCWLTERIAEWTQYQYRYAVPTQLVERLVDARDSPIPQPSHTTLVAMITTVFTSPSPLVNLSTSDIIANLCAVLLRRVAVDGNDSLLPPLVECIASLGAHVYYVDQIQDLSSELISRLVSVQVHGLSGYGRLGNDTGRNEALRCILISLVGLMQASSKQPRRVSDDDLIARIAADPEAQALSAARRTRVRPDTWQDTLALLCESEFSVRAEYANALVVFIKEEIQRETVAESVGDLGLARKSRAEHAARRMPTLLGDIAARFLHALHASSYTLAVSSSLGLSSVTPPRSHSANSSVHRGTTENGPSSTDPDIEAANGDASPEKMADGTSEKSGLGEKPSHRKTQPHRPRQLSLALSLLEPAPEQLSQSGPTPVGPSDYAYLLYVLTAAHEQLPTRSLLGGVPMLLALDVATQGEFIDGHEGACRRRAVRELVGRTWLVIARVWECPELEQVANTALATLPSPPVVEPLPKRSDGPTLLHPPELPHKFDIAESDLAGINWKRPFMDPEQVLNALSSNRNVQAATGLDRPGLLTRLSTKWTMEMALRDSVEKSSQFDVPRPSNMPPVVKLMHIENLSMQSLAKTSTRGVGVGDLREALEGRSSISNPNLVGSMHSHDRESITAGGPKRTHLSVAHEAFFAAAAGPTAGNESSFRPRTKSMLGRGTYKPSAAGGQDVRDVLNRIVTNKPGSSTMLKQPFPALQKRQPGEVPGSGGG